MFLYDFEKRILNKILQGEDPVLVQLRNQVATIEVVKRIMKDRYVLELNSLSDDFVSGKFANISIMDTCIKIRESKQLLYSDLWVKDGKLKFLFIDGDYNFKNKFEIIDLIWWKLVDHQEIFVKDENERDPDFILSLRRTFE